jgi:HlyD family secretion protein
MNKRKRISLECSRQCVAAGFSLRLEPQRRLKPAATRGLVLAALILSAGCQKPAAVAPPVAPSPALTVAKPQRKALPKIIEQPGTVQAYESTPLVAKVAGYVKKVHVDIGDRVVGPKFDSASKEIEPGTLLAELSIPELEDEAREKNALVAKAVAEKDQAERMREVADANYGAATAMIVEAKAGLKRAQGTYERWESENTRVVKMVRDKVINEQTGDETKLQFQSAESSRDEALARVTVAEKLLLKSKADVESARAGVRVADAKKLVAESEAARWQSLLGYRFIRAPFDGAVTLRKIDTGHLVRPAAGNDDPLFVVVRSNVVRVVLKVPEADAALVRKGAEVKIGVQALPGVEFAGKISRTSESLDASSRTLRTEIDLQNPDGRLRVGNFVSARITADMPEAWVLPASAVIKQADVTVCFQFKQGKAVRTPIQVGRSDGTFTEVFKKQKAGSPAAWENWTGDEQVLAGQTANLTDGQSVQAPKNSE